MRDGAVTARQGVGRRRARGGPGRERREQTPAGGRGSAGLALKADSCTWLSAGAAGGSGGSGRLRMERASRLRPAPADGAGGTGPPGCREACGWCARGQVVRCRQRFRAASAGTVGGFGVSGETSSAALGVGAGRGRPGEPAACGAECRRLPPKPRARALAVCFLPRRRAWASMRPRTSRTGGPAASSAPVSRELARSNCDTARASRHGPFCPHGGHRGRGAVCPDTGAGSTPQRACHTGPLGSSHAPQSVSSRGGTQAALPTGAAGPNSRINALLRGRTSLAEEVAAGTPSPASQLADGGVAKPVCSAGRLSWQRPTAKRNVAATRAWGAGRRAGRLSPAWRSRLGHAGRAGGLCALFLRLVHPLRSFRKQARSAVRVGSKEQAVHPGGPLGPLLAGNDFPPPLSVAGLARGQLVALNGALNSPEDHTAARRRDQLRRPVSFANALFGQFVAGVQANHTELRSGGRPAAPCHTPGPCTRVDGPVEPRKLASSYACWRKAKCKRNATRRPAGPPPGAGNSGVLFGFYNTTGEGTPCGQKHGHRRPLASRRAGLDPRGAPLQTPAACCDR